MFSAIWAWIVGVCKALLKCCTQQWYLVETKPEKNGDWDEYYPTHCVSLTEAKRYLVDAADTYFWIKCRILDPDGRVVDETVANDFYGAPPDIVFMYVETSMTCAEVMKIWRRQQLKAMDSRECSDVTN